MSKVREWVPAGANLPKIMEDVLICSKDGEIYKAFQNLNNVWIMRNIDSITSWRYKDESFVAAWMKLPAVYKKYSKEGWIRTDKQLPDPNVPVLISTEDAVYISHVRGGDSSMWWMRNRNEKGADSAYLFKSSVVAWMPLPEVFKVVA